MKGKYSSQIENGLLHKVPDLLRVTPGCMAKQEKIALGAAGSAAGILPAGSRPRGKAQPHKPDC